MIIHNVQQGTEEWFEIRMGKLTASTAQAIATAGKGLETLCFEKVSEILTGGLNSDYTNPDMERGKELESMARSNYEMETGNLVEEVGFVVQNEFVGCSPDGFVGDNGLVEIKCPNNINFTKYLFNNQIDKKYYWQMQMQMLVTGRKWVDYVVFNPNFQNSTQIQRVEKVEKDQTKIMDGLDKGIELIKSILDKVEK